ncbi:MAG: hypothetical protein AB7I50_00170 [Vicinamibacterales bacterium]
MRRIALLAPIGTPAIREALARTTLVARRSGIDARTFIKSEDVVDYEPDCVLAWSCQDAKLTSFPTYGVLTPPSSQYMRTRRFIRNVLTYDASLTLSEATRRWVADLAFGARKFSCPTARFGCTVPKTAFSPGSSSSLAYVGSTPDARTVAVIDGIARTEPVAVRGARGTWAPLGYGAHAPVGFDGESVLNVYREAGIGLNVTSPGCTDGLPPLRLLEIVAGSAAAITVDDPQTRRFFGDTLFYVPDVQEPDDLAAHVLEQIFWIRAHRRETIERVRAAHDIVMEQFSMDVLFTNLREMHERVLSEKGYRPDADPAAEDALPSATYIMRTGGGRSLSLIRRALDSMVAQQYPRLRALLVLFRPMPEVEQLKAEYPSLAIQVVDDFGGLRSTAICAGMCHVETDLFGLLDDDDVLSPNHVRMLVKALAYHNGRTWRGKVGMAYSGSLELGETQARAEHAEYADAYALTRRERRVMEHYRTYSTTQMSQHGWYLINTWLASRDLIDDELLDDPRIHTCEDLYVALQLAQRTFLAFSGEVTMNHCYLDASSTIVDSHRHLADTLRGAVRHWTRLLPPESGHDGALMPTGQLPASSASEETERNLVGHLLARRQDLVPGGGVILDTLRDSPLEVRSIPIEFDQAWFALRVEIDDVRVTDARPAWIRIDVLDGGTPAARIAGAGFAVEELDWRGDLRCATLGFRLPDQRPVTIRLERAPNVSLVVRRLVVLREPGLSSGAGSEQAQVS